MNMIRNEDKGKRSEEINIMQRDTSDMRDKRWRRDMRDARDKEVQCLKIRCRERVLIYPRCH